MKPQVNPDWTLRPKLGPNLYKPLLAKWRITTPEILTGVSQMRLSRRMWIITTTIAVLAYPVYYLPSPLFIVTRVSEPLPSSNFVAQDRKAVPSETRNSSASREIEERNALRDLQETTSYLLQRFGDGPPVTTRLLRSCLMMVECPRQSTAPADDGNRQSHPSRQAGHQAHYCESPTGK